MNAPIALFVYKRLDHTKQTVQSLINNKFASESDLYIFSDAAKSEKDIKQVEEVRKYIRTISGFNRINIFERSVNFGLSRSIISGVTQICQQYGKIIVLEDDMVLSPYFLEYMNNGLNVYECNERVGSIHGYTYPIKKQLPETFFMRGGDCWGWATWLRAWSLFEADGAKLLQQLNSKSEYRSFNLNDTVPNVQMLKAQISGINDSWAIRWHASLFLQHMHTLYPGQSLVQNIGTDESGAHCEATNDYKVKLCKHTINVIEQPVITDQLVLSNIQNYFQRLKPTWLKRFMHKIENIFSVST
jgi:hypothetical protein